MDADTDGYTSTADGRLIEQFGITRLNQEWDLSPADRAGCLERVNMLVNRAIGSCPDALVTVVAGWLGFAMLEVAEAILTPEQWDELDMLAFRSGSVRFDSETAGHTPNLDIV